MGLRDAAVLAVVILVTALVAWWRGRGPRPGAGGAAA